MNKFGKYIIVTAIAVGTFVIIVFWVSAVNSPKPDGSKSPETRMEVDKRDGAVLIPSCGEPSATWVAGGLPSIFDIQRELVRRGTLKYAK